MPHTYGLSPRDAELVGRAAAISREVLARHAADVDARGRFPEEALAALAKEGFLGLCVPTELGGKGGGLRAFIGVAEELAQGCASTAMIFVMHVSAQQGDRVVTDLADKDAILRSMAGGRHLTTLAFSEKGSRSHFWAPVSRLEPKGAGFQTSAHKSWVTSASRADSYVSSAQKPGAGSPLESTIYLVKRDAAGVKVAAGFDGLGLRGNDSAPVTIEGLAVAAGDLISAQGEGAKTMLEVVLPWFAIGTAAMANGLCRAAVTATAGHMSGAGFEHLGGQKLRELPTLRARLAEMSVRTEQARALLGHTMGEMENPSEVTPLFVLQTRLASLQAADTVTDLAMKACGGAAFSKHLPVERIYRDARAGWVMAPTVDHLLDFVGKALTGLPLFNRVLGFAPVTVGLNREQLLAGYRRVRTATEALAAPLAAEDQVVQSMPEVSPTKWHLAHTTWFFETFVLRRALSAYRTIDERYAYLFNSYYVGVGERHPQPQRGVLSRPTVAQVLDYRRHVDRQLERLLADAPSAQLAPHLFAVELGLHHEQQHQELVVTDIKHVFSCNPLEPVYRSTAARERPDPAAQGWQDHPGGLVNIGHGGDGFAFDNEGPRHRVHLDPFAIARRPVSCGDWLGFIADGGYRRPELWLADGWDLRSRAGWQAPLYWGEGAAGWELYTLGGRQPVAADEPVAHVSFYEADAFARWAGARLPREQEWEALAPAAGQVWEWTASSYLAYPGYRPFAGAFGEYNGKFMSNRMVLRGGSCATPAGHLRPTYRNFFTPDARWQFSGLRLARPA